MSVVLFVPASALLLFIPLLLTAELSWVAYVIDLLQKDPHASKPRRLWAGHRQQAAKPSYRTKVCRAKSLLWNPMAAIKPFIFYALVS